MSYASLAEVSGAETGEFLGDMTIWALQQKAQSLGVGETALEEVEEKAELITLIGDTQAAQLGVATGALQDTVQKAEGAHLEELRTELEGTKLRALQRRAKQSGVDEATLAAVADKASLVQLVLDAEQSPMPWLSMTAGNADRWLTNRETGEPTLFFHVARLSCVLFSTVVCVGTFFTPSLTDAVELRDPLLFVAVFLLAMVVGPGTAFLIADVRRLCRCTGEDVMLLRLGTGAAVLSPKQHAGIKKYSDMVERSYSLRGMWRSEIRLPTAVLCAPVIITGWGVHSPRQNRLTAAAIMLGLLLVAPALGNWTAMLNIATRLINAKIDAITAALDLELKTPGTDMTAKQWDEKVVRPVRGLIRDLGTVSDGCGKGTVMITLVSFARVCTYVCLALSPSLGPWAVAHSGVPWLSPALTCCFALAAMFNLFYPLEILAAPCSLSTACDDLREKLNEVRISDLSPELDARLTIIERAMANVNHGQGVGFRVPPGIVIDKKMLKLMTVKLYAGGSAAFTLFASRLDYTAYDPSAGVSTSIAQCELSVNQVDMVQDMLQERNASCVYNMTLESILEM
eukprot:COSAG02_NODE_2276_length_9242_cov_933.673411_1_plen_571_part_00